MKRRATAKKEVVSAEARFEQWVHDPLTFVHDNWSISLEPFQEEALKALAETGRVAIRSGHGVGKSTLDALAILWYQSTRFPCKIPITAPSAHQLEDVLRPEIGMWLNKAPHLASQFTLKADKLVLNADPESSFAAFRTGNRSNPDALQGFHADNLLFILDEASGIDDRIFEVSEGALSTPGAKVLMTGNPTKTSGYFYDAFHADRRHWHTMHVPCSASRRASQEYIDRAARHGTDSNFYRVRVLGEFPRAEDDAVISMELVEAATSRDVRPATNDQVWGLDVARFGDARTVLCKRQGNVVEESPKIWRQKDNVQIAGLMRREYDDAKVKPKQIFVDVIGVGAGVVDIMKHDGLPVTGINVAERPSINDRFKRYRDELWWTAREWFENRDCRIPDDDELIAELTGIHYSIPFGKIIIESKDDLRRHGKPSPDIADAFVLTFATGRYAKQIWKPLNYDNRGIV